MAGTFGVVGAAGALVAPLAGRLADKHGSRMGCLGRNGAACRVVSICYGPKRPRASSTVFHLVALVVGVVVLDMGAQMTQVANQTRIFGLVPSARSRLNTVYMTVYFSGAAAGSALATIAWVHWRWNGVCLLALGLIALAGIVHALGHRGVGRPLQGDG